MLLLMYFVLVYISAGALVIDRQTDFIDPKGKILIIYKRGDEV